MPDIRWEIDQTFRRHIARDLATWDPRVSGPVLNIMLQRSAACRPEADGPEDVPVVKLKMHVDVAVEGGRQVRTFVVRPATPADEKLIAEWVRERERSRKWLREDET